VQTWNYENISPDGFGHASDSDAPSYVDYDRWLGPAPKRPFNVNRFHMLFRWYYDYAGGMLADWGVHLNDIVLWALDAKAPQSVTASGGVFTSDDDRDTPDSLQVLYDFSRVHPHLLDAQGERPETPWAQLWHPVLRHRRQHDPEPRGLRDHPRQGDPSYGIKSVKGDHPLRKIDLKATKATGRRRSGGPRRHFLRMHAHPRCRPICDIEIGDTARATPATW